MKYDKNDSESIACFSEALSTVCDDIMNGVPKSRACERHGVSLTMFNKVLHGLRKKSESSELAPSQNNISYKPWQDRLVADLGGDENTYIPEDFENELEHLESTYLTDDETAVISAYYKEHMSSTALSQKLGIAESTANSRKNSALRKLRKHRDELFHGREYDKRLTELQAMRKAHVNELKWMNDAIDFLKNTDTDADIPIDDTDVSNEAKAFFKKNGFLRIGDIMNIPLEELFVKVTDVFDDEGAFLSIDSGLSPDTPLSNIGLEPRTVKALEWKDLHTVEDVLQLPASEAVKIPHVPADQIVYIYRLVLFGDS